MAKKSVAMKKNLAKAKVQLGRAKVKARKGIAKVSGILKRHGAALKVAMKGYQGELKRKKRPA